MKVLVIGYSKTGTKSMHIALKTLGYKVYDYEHNFYYLCKEWTKILTEGATKDDWYNMYKDIDASMDIPVCLFWEETLKVFPNCKLIFNERKSEEEWWVSLRRTADNMGKSRTMAILTFLSPTANRIYDIHDMLGAWRSEHPHNPFTKPSRASVRLWQRSYKEITTPLLN